MREAHRQHEVDPVLLEPLHLSHVVVDVLVEPVHAPGRRLLLRLVVRRLLLNELQSHEKQLHNSAITKHVA